MSLREAARHLRAAADELDKTDDQLDNAFDGITRALANRPTSDVVADLIDTAIGEHVRDLHDDNPDPPTPPPPTRWLDAALDRLAQPVVPPTTGLEQIATNDPTDYDAARNIGPVVIALTHLHAITGDTRTLNAAARFMRPLYDNLRDRGNGYRELRRYGNDKMDGLMSAAASLLYALEHPPGPTRDQWLDWLDNDWLEGRWGGTPPTHGLTHPTLARAILQAARYGTFTDAAGHVSSVMQNGARVDVPDPNTDETRTVFVWRHHATKATFPAQTFGYGHYTALYLTPLAHLGVAPPTLLEEAANAVSHYALTSLDPIVIEPSIIGNDDPPTGLSSGASMHYGATHLARFPGYALLAPHEPTGELADALLTVHETDERAWAPALGLALAEALGRLP